VVNGRLFRAFSEQVTTECCPFRQRAPVSTRGKTTLVGVEGNPTIPEESKSSYGNYTCFILQKWAHISILFDRYGTDIKNILGVFSVIKNWPNYQRLMEYFVEEIQYLIEIGNHPSTLEDLVVRRTNLAIEGGLNNNVPWSKFALLMEESMGWDDSILIAQLEHCSKRPLCIRMHVIWPWIYSDTI